MEKTKRPLRVAFFGHFGGGNFGNESTLQTVLYHYGRMAHGMEATCICSGPKQVAADYHVMAVDISGVVIKPWRFRNTVARTVRKIVVGVPCEIYRWFRGIKTLKGIDALIIPGTGLLTDAFGPVGWGPYGTFKWSVLAKLCRCKLLFVSVGAGPLYSATSRFLVRFSLWLADFRSYRDESTKKCLEGIGFRTDRDAVYPDLVFSLPHTLIPVGCNKKRQRPVVGLGVMQYAGRYSADGPCDAVYQSYLQNLVTFVRWLLAHEYDIRLLIGDVADVVVTKEFKELLKSRIGRYDEGRIIDEPVESLPGLLSQLQAVDFVVATRFHNVLLALLVNKPVIAISFHHKCVSLMRSMGLLEYCQDISELNVDRLVEQFNQLERNSAEVKSQITQRTAECRQALASQYERILAECRSV